MPYLYRAGTEMWIGGSYDWDLNLVYQATSQAKPTYQSAIGSLTPELTPGRAGNVLMVFALPQSASGRPSR